ncbi:MAG: alpha/beta fold hydrolase, partial [Bryobacteraceae bacterium]
MVPDAPVLTMEQLATDVLGMMDQVGLRKAVFAGCSIGGYVLLEMWRRAPERMTGLVFICSKPQADGPAHLTRRAEIIQRARTEGVTALFDGMAQS